MAAGRVLITGGAGFIGSHLADDLLQHGYRVRVLDNLTPQVHGGRTDRPEYLHPEVEFVLGDVRDARGMRSALEGVDAVVHFAAAVGVGQSMYEIEHYTSVNNMGTAVLLEAMVATRRQMRLLVASSMSIYGEGMYTDAAGHPCMAEGRTLAQLEAGRWELRSPEGTVLLPVPTPESKKPSLASVYALSKYDQERLCLMVGGAYRFPVTALRFFNVYGTRQALSNPYTGVLAIFASRLLNGNPPRIFEDGFQRRDFVNVADVARACRLALERDEAAGEVLNIGSGQSRTVREVAEAMARVMGREDISPDVTGTYRVGDIRHCFADISRAERVLGYRPYVRFEEGLAELAAWLEGQVAVDCVTEAHSELAMRGLTI
ncbi:MAG TPA: NAD-dependent epimerase/dehydratase family protein [Verrucomicrobiae bacterium]|nr:NAD-dependent epimerase/dehydratase family protein [Verrucomicrobiae bacterium]